MTKLCTVRISLLIVVAVPLCAVNGSTSDEIRSGAEIYQTCAVCHLPGGEGIPGAFPKLNNRLARLASSAAGRAYVIMVLKSGLMGPINVDGTMFQGVMPAQPLQAGEISRVLNYVARDLGQAPEGWRPFSENEVKGTMAQMEAHGTGGSANAVAKLRRHL